MAEFPGEIRYTQIAPSGEIGAVNVPVEADTGWRAIVAGSAELGNAFAKMQDANDAMEFSEKKRRAMEIQNARIEGLRGIDPFDKAAIDKVDAAYKTDIESLYGDNNRVNNGLKVFLNNSTPNWDKDVAETILGYQRKDARDRFDNRYQDAASRGEVGEMANLLQLAKATDAISPEDYEFLSENLFTDAALEMANRNFENGKYKDVTDSMNELKKTDLTTEQLERANKMIEKAEKQNKAVSDAAITSVVIKKNNLKDASLEEKEKTAVELKQELVDGGVSGDALNKWFGILDDWAVARKDPTEEYAPQTYTALTSTVTLNPRSISEPKIFSFVGLGKEGGITTDQAKELVALRKTNIDKVGSMQMEIHKRYQDVLKEMYKAEIFDGALEYAETANKLTVWTNANKEATPEQTEKFFEQLIEPTKKKSWLKMIFTPPVASLHRIVSTRRKLKKLRTIARTQTLQNKSDEELLLSITGR